MKTLWLDDIRDPAKFGFVGATLVTTADEAIEHLKTGQYDFASLDHDLTIEDTLGIPKGEKTGYTVVCWMDENDCWPEKGVRVHSMNPSGKQRMEAVIYNYYGRNWR